MKKEIIDILTWVMNRVTEQQQYSKWSDSYARKDVNSALSEAHSHLQQYIDWANLTAKDCEELRFGKWANDDDIKEDINYLEKLLKEEKITQAEFETKKQKYLNTKGLMLIPLWLFPLLPIGTEVISIFGDKIIYDGKNVNNDIRMGCIAYGIVPKK